MRRFCGLIFSLLISCSILGADDFVPFVIPTDPNPHSLIAVKPEPIKSAADRIVVKNGHFFRGDKRIRFWGVNLSFGASLPSHKDAVRVARRLASVGVNAVRMHHLDSSRWPRGIFDRKTGKTLEPEALDRMDFFINELARQGVYVDLNLHVGHAHSRDLGLPVPNRKYDKIVGIFTPALVEAQKQYARKLLTRVNPYRKVSYARDPALAIVEITNEDSCFMWNSMNTLRTLPAYYTDILQQKYNKWLKAKYQTTENLKNAWNKNAQPLGKNMLGNSLLRIGGRKDLVAQWVIEQHGKARMKPAAQKYRNRDGLQLKILDIDGTDWHLQFNQRGLSIKKGQYYTVSFTAAAEKPRSISCSLGQAHEPWKNLGFSRKLKLGTDWKSYRFGFVAESGDEDARLSFMLGDSTAAVYLADIKLQTGGQAGLSPGESLEKANVTLFASNETKERILDRMCFLAEMEKGYFDDMRKYIRKDLGGLSLVTGTIVFGPLGMYAQSDMDFIDGHAYWQHPRFPGRPWDSNNWLVEQKPMTDYPEQSTLLRLAAERLFGKPFTVTEYNHPAPQDSQAECIPMIASFAAAYNWDGVWLYTYSHGTDDWDRQEMKSYFDIDSNPAKWGFMRAGAAIFRFSGIYPLKVRQTVQLVDEGRDRISELARLHLKYDRDMFALLQDKAGIKWQDIFHRQFVFSYSKSTITTRRKRIIGPSMYWIVDEKTHHGFYGVHDQKCWISTGHAETFARITGGQLTVSKPEFVSLAVTALDNLVLPISNKVLITACGRCENRDMKFSPDRRTVGRNWGHAPVGIEPVQGSVRLPQGQWQCHALAPDGTATVEVPVENGVVKLSPKYNTMWYLVARKAAAN